MKSRGGFYFRGSCRRISFGGILDGAYNTSKIWFTYTHFSLLPATKQKVVKELNGLNDSGSKVLVDPLDPPYGTKYGGGSFRTKTKTIYQIIHKILKTKTVQSQNFLNPFEEIKEPFQKVLFGRFPKKSTFMMPWE